MKKLVEISLYVAFAALAVLIGIKVAQYSDLSSSSKLNVIPVVTYYNKVCYDDVIYLSGNKRLTVWINPKTLKPSNCDNLK